MRDSSGFDMALPEATYPQDAVQIRAAVIFAEAVRQAAAGDLSVAALIGTAETLRALRAGALAAETYRTWLTHNAAHPLAYAARFNFSVTLTDLGDLPAARDVLMQTLADKPDFAPASINLGSILERLDDRPAAVAAWQSLANRLGTVNGDAIGHRCTALNQIGRVLEAARVDAPAEAVLRASLQIDPTQRLVAQHFVSLRQTQCAWPVLPADGPMPERDLLAATSPLSMAALIDDPVLQLANAQRYYALDAQAPAPVTVGSWPAPGHIATRPLRIGYLSSDMREHAVGYLAAELFELHDRARVEVFAYYCGPAREDGVKARYRAGADHWVDLSPLDDRQAALKIVRDGIDILVDVNGYTKDGRPKLSAYRPAPCIVNWLGFPGTMGSPHHHYIIADDFIIPEGDEKFYSERVLRLPCYQPNDRLREVADTGQTRAEAGLPEKSFVFCAFNGPQKITPGIFAIWMAILHAVSDSVLWVLCPETATADALRAHASGAGIDPQRLVFAGRMVNAAHLARYRLADLFLDTAPYGAHTTASDALWMGLPVLTCPGNSFAARVCGSLVRAAGLPELVCDGWDIYQRLACALAQDRPYLAALTARLRQARSQSVLFDTPLLVRSLEKLYETIWQDYLTSHLPLPVLHHLPAYHDIGCEAGRPALPHRAALLDWYASRLAYRDAVHPLPQDGLLRNKLIDT